MRTWNSNPGRVCLLESSADWKVRQVVDDTVPSGGDSTSFLHWPNPNPAKLFS